MRFLNNYAGQSGKEWDALLRDELAAANIQAETLPECLRESRGEVKSIVVGTLIGWTFERAWRYWVCYGPGIPCADATELHKEFGSWVRVDGHGGCLSPYERFRGLAVGHYHVDTVEGLAALAACIRGIAARAVGQFDK